MKKYEKSQATIMREEAYKKMDPKVLAEPLNTDYEKGIEELAQLLTFLPEETRIKTIQGYIRSMLQS